MALDAFEQWLYASTEAEAVVGPGEFLELIERNYRGVCTQLDLSPDRANLRGPSSASQELASLYSEGNEWVPLEFVGIASDLDCLPAPVIRELWGEQAVESLLARNAAKLDDAHVQAREAARQMLDRLKESDS